jgi:hypothetical protein
LLLPAGMDLLRSRRQALGGASCRALVELRAELLQSLVELLQSFARSFVQSFSRALAGIRAELRARLLLLMQKLATASPPPV